MAHDMLHTIGTLCVAHDFHVWDSSWRCEKIVSNLKLYLSVSLLIVFTESLFIILNCRVQMGYLLQQKGQTEEASQLYNLVQKNR